MQRVAFFTNDGLIPKASADTLFTIGKAVEVLRTKGISVSEDMPKVFTQASSLMYRICGHDGLQNMVQIIDTIDSDLILDIVTEITEDKTLRISTSGEKQTLDDDIMQYKAELAAFFDNYDALVLPVASFPAVYPTETFMETHDRGLSQFRFTYAWNVAQFPALVVGAVHTTKDGIPIGVQVVVPPFREDVAFKLGRILEDNIQSISSLRPTKLLEQTAQNHHTHSEL